VCVKYRVRHSENNVLHPNGPSLSYIYPTSPDILQVLRQDIFMNVDLFTGTESTYNFRAERMTEWTRNTLPFIDR
jgi:hypothetical protein